MKKLFLVVVLVLAAQVVSAQTITCSVSGASAKQTTLYASFLAAVNAQRAAQTPALPPFANFGEHCAAVMLSAFQSYVAQQATVDASKVGAQATSHGDEVATNTACSAASLANGCTKSQVACVVLSGNATCN